jgi:hypothetical protein
MQVLIQAIHHQEQVSAGGRGAVGCPVPQGPELVHAGSGRVLIEQYASCGTTAARNRLLSALAARRDKK